MKYLITTILILSSLAGFGQIIQFEAGRNTTAKSNQYGLTIGAMNYNNDSFSGGLVLKQYATTSRIGGRINIQLSVTDWLFIHNENSIFFQKDMPSDAGFLESAIGIGVNYKNFMPSIAWQMREFDVSSGKVFMDCVNLKLAYRIKFNN